MLAAIRKRNTALDRFAGRMAVLICTNMLTWIPMIVLQILVATGYPVTPQVFLWIVLCCFSVNLTLDPILVLQGVIKKQ